MNEMKFSDYVEKYIDIPVKDRVCRFWDESKEQMQYRKFDEIEKRDMDYRIMLAIGVNDSEGNQIFTGDILHIEIETKYGDIERIGVVRSEGLYCCGIDYMDRKGKVTEEGDFIDEFFIKKKVVIGNLFEGILGANI